MSGLKISHWKERTPEFWRKVGNTAVYSLPLLSGTIMASPLSADIRQWLVFGLSVCLVAAKGLTKFLKEEKSEG